MTTKELANILSDREYLSEISDVEKLQASIAGLVAVYGQSDDNVEFAGAIDDEESAWGGTVIHLSKNGILSPPDDDCEQDKCPYYAAAKNSAKSIKAVWHDDGDPCWSFETDIPHETFDIYEDGELFCVGIVFSMEDL